MFSTALPLNEPARDGNGGGTRPKEDGECEGLVSVEEGLEGKDVRLAAVVNYRDFSVPQRAPAAGSAIRLDSLKDIVFSYLGEPLGKSG
jgi:hypothetical protein